MITLNTARLPSYLAMAVPAEGWTKWYFSPEDFTHRKLPPLPKMHMGKSNHTSSLCQKPGESWEMVDDCRPLNTQNFRRIMGHPNYYLLQICSFEFKTEICNQHKWLRIARSNIIHMPLFLHLLRQAEVNTNQQAEMSSHTLEDRIGIIVRKPSAMASWNMRSSNEGMQTELYFSPKWRRFLRIA